MSTGIKTFLIEQTRDGFVVTHCVSGDIVQIKHNPNTLDGEPRFIFSQKIAVEEIKKGMKE